MISIALIHNNEASRNNVIMPQLDALCVHLAPSSHVNLFDIGHQVNIKPHSIPRTLLREFRFLKSDAIRDNHRLLPKKTVFQKIKRYLKFIKLCARICTSNGAKKRRLGAIEWALTDKHIGAWDRFLNSDMEYLLVFEDDAVLNADSAASVNLAIEKMRLFGSESCIYVDLAGGNSFESLKVDALVTNRAERLIYLSRPFSNTTCAYAINKKTAYAFKSFIINKPALRKVAADRLVDELFVKIIEANLPTGCFHFLPPAIDHGSFKGQHSSLLR